MMKIKNKAPRRGIAIVIALIFMMAMLTISTTIAGISTRMSQSTGGSYKSIQALYNAETANERALNVYTFGKNQYNDITSESEQWKILGVSGNQGNLSSELIGANNETWHSYPFPGSGTVGKDCDVYRPVNSKDTFESSLLGYVSTANQEKAKQEINAFGTSADHPCNWNKLKDTDSAIEIPLYGINPTDGSKTHIPFDAIEVRVRTACDTSKLQDGFEKEIYEGTSMCVAGERYGMHEVQNHADTIINWGIYSEKNGDWMIPVKDGLYKDVNPSNITSNKINTGLNNVDFVVLNQETKAKKRIGTSEFQNASLLNALSEYDSGSPLNSGIQDPYLRLTIEFPYPDPYTGKLANYFMGETSRIPYLEYQILYKTSGDPASGTDQITGVPTIIGEGYSGGFRHMIRADIFKTSTGFDYVYQKP